MLDSMIGRRSFFKAVAATAVALIWPALRKPVADSLPLQGRPGGEILIGGKGGTYSDFLLTTSGTVTDVTSVYVPWTINPPLG